VLFHVLAVVVLSFPSSYKIADRNRWTSPRTQREIGLWSERLRDLGFETTHEELDARLWSLAQSYVAARETIAAPFSPYARYFGAAQGWGMFRSPEREPGTLAVEIREGSGWRRVHQSRSAEHAWLEDRLEQNRMRKLVGRSVADGVLFRDLARWLAGQLARDFPEAKTGRVLLLRAPSPTPAERAAGTSAPFTIARQQRFDLEKLR
jgi:hypothetical protein